MKFVRVSNLTRQAVVCEKCGIANNIFTRVRGLLGRKGLEAGEGLLIVPCPSIHMFMMKFSLDVVFLTQENIVTDFVEDIAPGKLYVAKNHFGKPYSALEINPGMIVETGLQRGDAIRIEPRH